MAQQRGCRGALRHLVTTGLSLVMMPTPPHTLSAAIDQRRKIMRHRDHNAIWRRWELYPERQKEAILEEFRRRLPDDHYNKEFLLEFLKEKFERQDG